MLRLLLSTTLLINFVVTIPTHGGFSKAISASVESDSIPPLFSFDNGNVGVNFLGFRAAAGLGGLLTGNAADGGLHAEAGTPFGQSAGAGLGGTVDADGRTAGGLYAGATAGGGVGAGAGLAGVSDSTGSVGKSYAGASAGDVETHITKISHKPVAASGKLTASISAPAEIHKDVEIIAEQPKPQTTYVERTVIPNYVEKTIQVPTYVEKTIRVPTVVEKRIRVPAEPTVIEKTVEAPNLTAKGSFSGEVAAAPVGVSYVQKTKIRPHHAHSRIRIHKNFGLIGGGAGGYGGGFGGGYAGGYGGGYGGGFGGSGSGSYTVTKTANPQFYNDIFNIPISTLGAVSKLVSGIAGGASGSVSVSKSYGVAAA